MDTSLTNEDRALILTAIERLRVLTNTVVTIAANEKVQDGTRVLLESPDGWVLSADGFRVKNESVVLLLKGHILNENKGIFEALTLHCDNAAGTYLRVVLDGSNDYVTVVTTHLVPAVAKCAKAYHHAIAVEKARKEQIAHLKEHFQIVGSTKKFSHGAHNLELSVGSAASDWNQVGLTLKADGLSPAQVEAILKVLDNQTLSS